MNVCTPGRALHLPGSSFHVHDDFTDYSDACVGCACDDNGDDDDYADDDDDVDDDVRWTSISGKSFYLVRLID